MIQTTPRPVTVFRSTDDSAPQLNRNAGCLKTILEACLITGYGEKTALGWTMEHHSANKAAFKSQAFDSNKYYLQIANENGGFAHFKCFRTLSAFDSGEGMFSEGRFPYRERSWTLVGHEAAFWFFIHEDQQSFWLYFGDFPSIVPADNGNVLHAQHRAGDHESYGVSRFFPPAALSHTTGVLRAARSADGLHEGVEMRINSQTHALGNHPYPDPISFGLQAAPVFLYQNVDRIFCYRGDWNGVYYSAHNLSSIPEGSVISTINESDHAFLKVHLNNIYEGGFFLIDLTEW